MNSGIDLFNNSRISDNNYYFFFETNKFDDENYRSYYFRDPVKIVRLTDSGRIEDFFKELTLLGRQYYMAGFFSYELGYYLEPAFSYQIDTSFPLAFFCAYESPVILDHRSGNFSGGATGLISSEEEYIISNPELNISEENYKNNIRKIRDYIRKGDIYQANYTVKYKFDFSGSPFAFYQDLKRKQHVAYNVFARFDDYYVLSLTPELFYRKKGNNIIVKPMKGTFRRGRTVSEDDENRDFLYNDEKNRSENVMIVDLLRNDIGKVSEGGSVRVNKLWEIEKYNSLFQMTSTVESILKDNVSTGTLIRSIFPSGSITGAPKIRCMEIIRDLEKEDRNLYTGSLGFFEPSGDSVFNVAIRTILLHEGKGEMGVGGGIVYDSTPEDEFDECRLKAGFLVQKNTPDFSLIETILYDKEYEYLDLHLARLKESARYFDYEFNGDKIIKELDALKQGLNSGRYKVRVLLGRFGDLSITHSLLDSLNTEFNIRLSGRRTHSNDIFLFHKTSNRDLYEAELAESRANGFFDAVFMNEKDEITEGSITNVYIKKDGEIFTPPVECGLLNGIIRRSLLADGKIKEKRITLDDLRHAETFYISNSIVGFRQALFIE
jgi:para-aminobenzoate synthetase / 4-amino-4-deoxychorismate lyase